MSQGRREARREARRAESPPDPRGRRRRRLNSSSIAIDQPRPTEFVSSWLEQQDLTRSGVPAQTTPLTNFRMFPSTQLRATSHPNFLNSALEQETTHSVVSMRDHNTTMQYNDAGPSSAYHPPAVDIDADDLSTSAPIGDRSMNSRRSGPLLNMALSAADSDDISSDTSESSQEGGVRLWSSHGAYPLARSTGVENNPLQSSQFPRHVWGARNIDIGLACEDERSAKKPTYPENPALLLVYQLDRNTPEPTLRFLPFISVSQKRKNKSKNKRFMIQPSHKQSIDASQLTARRAQWVPGEFPVELFELINQYLSRDDIKSMRLVSKEFERGVSGSLFDTVVVPFNTELYEMIEQKVVKRDLKGKRRADDPINHFVNLDPGSLLWKNALDDTEDKVYRGHGLKVFEGFGHHIRRFGMSFEIKEDALQNPPKKNKLDSHESYFGSYEWPSQEYTRFELLAGLERTADETSQMKMAFSHLSVVQQLALSMDSGLGWMSGPDKSLRSTILQRPSPLFGCSHGIVDAQQQERIRLWESIESAHVRLGALDDLKEGSLEHIVAMVPGVADNEDHDGTETGVLYITPPDTRDQSSHAEAQRLEYSRRLEKFSPASLNTHQKEWLLEAEWAQRAFLTTYMLGVVDNSSVFDKVSVLNFRVSSHLVPLLCRHDFWTALPKLQEVKLAVIPDWRTVERDEAGIVETKDIDPSIAVDKTYSLLQDFIGVRPNITKLNFSWAAGGEHAEGIFARNHHILPAPITAVARSTATAPKDDELIDLPHLRDLTFSNCWFTPVAIVAIVKKLRTKTLKKIKFDSVSLTAMPRGNIPIANPNNHPMVNPNLFPQQAPGPGMMVIGGNFAAQFGAQVWQGPPPGMPVQQWAQAMIHTLNAMTQQQGIVLHQVPQVWTNHPMGLTMQQIHGMLAGLADGNGPLMPQPGLLYQLPQQQQQQQAGAAQFPQIGGPPPFQAPALPQAAGWPLPPQPAVHAATPQINNGPWYEGHRVGSWVWVVDKISPGPTLEMYQPRDEFEPVPEPRNNELVSAEFNSCGYVQLRAPTFGDQNNMEAPAAFRMSRHFVRRQSLLSSAMLATQDKLLGSIVQYMSEHETDALHHAWGMTLGWNDVKLAEEVEYDGYLTGGTGRFSGSVTKDSVMQEAYSAQHS
ncbi:unnamed protein product [Aureobasidium uvarum]|uniref:F-box domain-containing protein n=1 Tax=Aureobasidium uvarum TaxID=2773716 RepID=A0A9N8PPP5_9PEZI|nr:unnamed protein product [Aureobasidium uvarum]